MSERVSYAADPALPRVAAAPSSSLPSLPLPIRAFSVRGGRSVLSATLLSAALLSAALLSAALLAPPALAQAASPSADSESAPDAEDPVAQIDDEIVVSASRVPLERGSTGSAVTVITAEEIERHRWVTLADALRRVPGVEVSRSGGSGQVTSVFLRGGSSSQTLVLLDGVRLNSATTGAVDLADLVLDSVERIEIVRGPQSTLYGSEAMGGVISIFTRDGVGPARVHGRVEGGEGSRRRWQVGISGGSAASGAAGSSPGMRYRLSVSSLDTDGVSAADVRNGNPETDRHENLTAAASVGWTFGHEPGRGGSIDLDVRHIDGDSEIDGFSFLAGPVDDLDATNARQALIASVGARFATGVRATQSIRLSATDDTLEGSDPTNPFGNFQVESETLQAEWQADVRLGDARTRGARTRGARMHGARGSGHGLSFGLGWEERQGGSVGSFDESVELLSAFVQETYEGRRLTFTLGVRHDDHSDFGGETTGRLALSVAAGQRGRLHGSWGTGFAAPTLNDLYFPSFSNPDLEPETNVAFDLGYEHRWAGDRGRFDLTYFESDYEDLIAFDFVTFRPENIAEARSDGVELALSWDGARAGVSVSHTWNETEDLASGQPLARRPEHRSGVELYWQPTDALRLAMNAFSSRDRIDSDGSELEDYERLDLSASFDLDRWLGGTSGAAGWAAAGLEPYVRVVNVFDELYSEVGGYGSRGRTLIVGLSIGR